MKAITETMDIVIGLCEDEKKRFLKVITELAKVFALCVTEPKAEELNVEIVFFKAVKICIEKLIPTKGRKITSSQVYAQLNELISKSVISEEVIDIYTSLGLEKLGFLFFSMSI